jgi:hypothetical protein
MVGREPALKVFWDLTKAFDRVDHGILCKNLEAYGVTRIPLVWFKSYLSNRFQVVEIKGVRSDRLESKYGVPHGSILGPLFFIIYVNEIGHYITRAKPIIYADDTTLFFRGPS